MNCLVKVTKQHQVDQAHCENKFYDWKFKWPSKQQTAHAYFERPYFSKSFGGKINHRQTDVNKETSLTEKWHNTDLRTFFNTCKN